MSALRVHVWCVFLLWGINEPRTIQQISLSLHGVWSTPPHTHMYTDWWTAENRRPFGVIDVMMSDTRGPEFWRITPSRTILRAPDSFFFGPTEQHVCIEWWYVRAISHKVTVFFVFKNFRFFITICLDISLFLLSFSLIRHAVSLRALLFPGWSVLASRVPCLLLWDMDTCMSASITFSPLFRSMHSWITKLEMVLPFVPCFVCRVLRSALSDAEHELFPWMKIHST